MLKNKKLIISGIFFIILLIISSYKRFYSPVDLIIELKSNSLPQIYEVYYNSGNNFNERDSKKVHIKQINKISTVHFKLPMKEIKQIRFDPGNKPDTIKIKSISLHGWSKKHFWNASGLLHIITPLNNIEKISYKNNMVHITTNGNDPYFLFTGQFNNILKFVNNRIRIRYMYLISFILSILLLILSYLLKKPMNFLAQLFKKFKLIKYLKKLFQIKIIIPTVCIILLLVLFFPHLAIQFSEDLANHLHEELLYTVIVDTNINRNNTQQKQIESIFNFTRNHLFVFSGYDVIDKSPLNDLIRGIAWCDQQSYAFIKLLEEIGVQGRLIFLWSKNVVPASEHSVSEIFLNNKWIMYDPLCAQIYKNKNTNQLLSVSEIHHLVTSKKQNLIVNTINSKNISDLDVYSGKPKIFAYNHIAQNKEFFISITELYYSIFGKFFNATFQDSYFLRYHRSSSLNNLYRKAKMCYFMGRYQKAKKVFSKILETKELSKQYIDSLLWGSVTLLKLKKYTESISMLEKLENNTTKWKISSEIIAFYKGLNYLGMRKMELAKKWLLKADDSTSREYYLKNIFSHH